MRFAYWDIETWDLSAQFGPLVSASVLIGDEMVSFRQDDYIRRKKAKDMLDDRQLLLDLRDLLEGQHATAGWYSKGFDIPHVRTRLALHGERILKPQMHLDGIWYYKGWRGLKPMSSKMKHVSKFAVQAGVEGIQEKPEVTPEVWMAARTGDKHAIDEVVDRCESDVEITKVLCEWAIEMGLVKTIQTY